MDGNDKGSPSHKEDYPAFINAEQTGWLKKQLEEIDGPIVIGSHQPTVCKPAKLYKSSYRLRAETAWVISVKDNGN